MKRTLMAALAAACLPGCATFGEIKALENRVVCTVAKDEAHVVSKWGLFGISSKIAEADRKEICAK